MAMVSKKNPVDLLFSSITAIASFSVIGLIIGILYVLISESSLAIERFGVIKFLTSSDWNPVKESFGALTNIYGTVATTFLSLCIAMPVAITLLLALCLGLLHPCSCNLADIRDKIYKLSQLSK